MFRIRNLALVMMTVIVAAFILTTGRTAAAVLTDPVLNEFVFNHTGTDTAEFVEVAGDANSDYSAFTILEIEGDGSGAGVIDEVIVVGTTSAAGYWTTGFLNNAFENGTVSLLLVEGFSGAIGADLDAENDGTLDSAPWTRVVDSVAVNDGGSGDQTYADTTLLAGFDGGSFTVGGASRIPDRTDTDAVSDWVRNNFDGDGLPGFTATAAPGEAINTPDAENQVAAGAAPQLVINEVDYDQPETDAAEFVEIKNVGAVTASLDGVTLELVNGNGAVVYGSFALSSVTLAAGDYYVVCGNAANVPNCDLDVSPDTNLIQNGSPDAVGLRYNGVLLDAVSYEGDTAGYTEGSGSGLEDIANEGKSISRCEDGVDTDQNNVDFIFTTSTPGATNACDVPPPTGLCGEPATLISAVQGSGATSPLLGNTVIVEGIVVGDFQNNPSADNGDLNGFYVQEEDADADADPLTSEGVFVFAASLDVAVGDQVRVLGTVAEFSSSGGASLLTQLTNTEVLVCGTGVTLPAATEVTLPVTAVSDLERYEGMLTTFPQTLVISEYFNFDRFGEIVLTTDRQYTPTAVVEPGPAAVALAAEQERARITLDDGRSSQNPDPAIHPNGNIFDLTNTFRGGDLVQGATGVIDDTFGRYRVHPVQGANYTAVNPRPATPDDVGGNITVAAFNVLNYFVTIDDGVNDICGPQQNLECRGADSAEEFERQRNKIFAALAIMDADIVGLIEIENTTGVESVGDLVSGLNTYVGAPTYDYIDTGVIGTDAIKVALIYKPATVTPFGSYAILDNSVDPRFDDTKNRPVLAQSFQVDSSGEVFSVAVNHLKSKGSSCNDVGDPDLGDGAGNCNLTRLKAAQALVDWLATDPTGSGDPDALIVGDLNSYDKEDPIDAILAGPDDTLGTGDDYADLLFDYIGELAYGYVFDGRLGYLDYGMANMSLASQVTGATSWHINADEPDILDYDMSFKQPAQQALYEPNAFRSSDHDAVIVGLDVCEAIPPVAEVTATPNYIWPPNHKYVEVTAEVFATDNWDQDLTITLLSVESNEPDNGLGDGDRPNDIVIIDNYTFDLRAERSGRGDGRIYTITYQVTDDCGNSTIAYAEVTVPKNRRK